MRKKLALIVDGNAVATAMDITRVAVLAMSGIVGVLVRRSNNG